MPKPSKQARLILTMPPVLLKMLAAYVPPGQSRSEWIREAIRQRISREAKS